MIKKENPGIKMKQKTIIHHIIEGNHWIAEDIKYYGNFLDKIFPKNTKFRDATHEEIQKMKTRGKYEGEEQ